MKNNKSETLIIVMILFTGIILFTWILSIATGVSIWVLLTLVFGWFEFCSMLKNIGSDVDKSISEDQVKKSFQERVNEKIKNL